MQDISVPATAAKGGWFANKLTLLTATSALKAK
jgi:hypothetical protein